MVVIRNEKRIRRLRLISQVTSFLGFGALLAGLALLFISDNPQVFVMQLGALLVGWLLSQIGIYLAHQYVRKPRPDEVLDEAVKKVARDGRFYHFILPAPHVLLLPDGIIVFVAKYQTGKIRADGDNWKQSGLGLRRFFGQENLGNPTKEAVSSVAAVASFINKQAPEVEEVPIAAMIVFTTKGESELDVKKSNIPAMHFTKVKGYMKQHKRPERLPPPVYNALRAAFDERARKVGATVPDTVSAQ